VIEVSTSFVLTTWLVAVGSPGPATLAITGTAMERGRLAALILGSGVATGSAIWGLAAATGLSTLLAAHAWVFEVIRYIGAGYLMFLAWKSARRAIRPTPQAETRGLGGRLYRKGLLIHLTNPKAVLAWGAIFTLAVPAGAPPTRIWETYAMLLSVSVSVFVLYAVLFSNGTLARAYGRLRRVFDALFAGLFGAASAFLLTARL